MMSDNVLLLVSNTIRLALCVALAIAFDTWWLVFLVLLFWTYKT